MAEFDFNAGPTRLKRIIACQAQLLQMAKGLFSLSNLGSQSLHWNLDPGLAFIHKRGFAHLDLNTHNILCDEDGKHVWITGFAQATKLDADGKCLNINCNPHGEMRFLNYKAPEVCL